uniref:Uncharacterized protein n=1 Tax=Oncorhynchus tshawytscha TaxID=74940 RepID=A0A8C8FUA8_ONCTS
MPSYNKCSLGVYSFQCVTASVSASASMTQQLLGIMANGLRDLLNKVRRTKEEIQYKRFPIKNKMLETRLNSWEKLICFCFSFSPHLNISAPQARKDVAKITFDLYKNNPQDFFGCLNVKATLYGIYSVSYDVRCYAAKKMLKALRWTLFSMQATGHVLLGCSCYIEQLLYEDDRADRGLPPLPQEGKVKQQQSILMGWTAVMGKTVV